MAWYCLTVPVPIHVHRHEWCDVADLLNPLAGCDWSTWIPLPWHRVASAAILLEQIAAFAPAIPPPVECCQQELQVALDRPAANSAALVFWDGLALCVDRSAASFPDESLPLLPRDPLRIFLRSENASPHLEAALVLPLFLHSLLGGAVPVIEGEKPSKSDLLLPQPAGQAEATIHYKDTIERPVPLTTLEEHLTESKAAELREIYGDRDAPTWGVTPGEKNINQWKWDRIESGDRVLFSRSGGVFASAVVTGKTHNPGLARTLWRENAEEETWKYVYCVDDLEDRSISYEDFNRIVGYKSNAVIQGFNILNQEKSNLVLEFLLGVGAGNEEEDSELAEAAEAALAIRRSGQSFSGFPEARKAVEDYAMRCASAYFRVQEYDVRDRSKNHSFDLECVRGDETLLVEVKGTTTAGEEVLLTKNEVALAQDPNQRTVLYVQHGIQLNREEGKPKAASGHSRIIQPWEPGDEQLTAITYRCRI